MQITEREKKMSITMEVNGLNDLANDLIQLAKKYPDVAEDTMKKEQRSYRSKMIKETWKAVDRHSGNLTKGFRFGKIETFGGNIQSDFYAEGKKNKHFHLINNGHELVKDGKVIGFVPGRRIVEAVNKVWEEEHVNSAEKMMNRILDEVNG